MSQRELLTAVTDAIDGLSIPYMVTGSIASSLHGEPRSTHDIDLLVNIPMACADQFLSKFESPQYFLQRHVAVEAIQNRRMFTLLDQASGYKVDFWPIGASAFDQLRFSRRQQVDDGSGPIWISTPEDTILKKLRWSIDSGGSERQFRDALRVYELQYASLDQAYLEKWALELDVEEMWNRMKAEAIPLR